MSKDGIVAGLEYHRWPAPPAVVAVHLCIGSVYTWSLFNTPLTRLDGVAASNAAGWAWGR